MSNVLKNHPWRNAIFRKLLRGCFLENFLRYLMAALCLEDYISSSLLWLELYRVISLRCCADFFLCSEEQRAYYSSLLYNGLQKLFTIDHLPYSSDKKSCCSLLPLENCEILEKIITHIVKLWEKKKLPLAKEKRCEIEWHTVKLWE